MAAEDERRKHGHCLHSVVLLGVGAVSLYLYLYALMGEVMGMVMVMGWMM